MLRNKWALALNGGMPYERIGLTGRRMKHLKARLQTAIRLFTFYLYLSAILTPSIISVITYLLTYLLNMCIMLCRMF